MKIRNDVSTLTLAVLGTIARAPCSAYDVRKIFETTPMGRFSTSPGAIYPAIKRIEAGGWARSRVENPRSLRPKRVYQLTGAGRRVLIERLSQPITIDDVTRDLDDVLLRFTFMDGLLSTGAVIGFLIEFTHAMERSLASLRTLLVKVENELSVCEELTMQHGIAKARMNIAWAKRAIERLEKT